MWKIKPIKKALVTDFNLLSRLFISFIFCIVFFSSCNTTKFIPEGEYLLDKVNIEMDDDGVSESQLTPFIQQKPNNSTSVGIYNLVDNDSNFFKRAIRKLGEPGIIYKNNLVDLSVEELTAQMHNLGYLNADVSAEVDTVSAEKKARVTYYIHNGEPYRVRNFRNDISIMNTGRRSGSRGGISNFFRRNNTQQENDSTSPPRRQGRNRGLIREGTIFDMNILEDEINRVSQSLRNRGYYALTPNNLHYLADTTLRTNQVDLTMILLDSVQSAVPYTIERVNVFSGFDPAQRDSYIITDSVVQDGINIYYDNQEYLRPRVIARRILVQPGNLYRERAGESTYNLLQSLSGMGRVDMQYQENNYADSTLLDCNIYLTPGNNHSIELGVEGTNKAGDLGIALDARYGNLNIFNGGEVFNVHMRTAYEFVRSRDEDEINNNYYEIGITPSLSFPSLHLPFVNNWFANRFTSQTTYSLGYNIQRRPEFARNFFNFNWRFSWSSQRNILSQNLSLIDINYVNMPWKSAKFDEYLNSIDTLSRYSYNNVFTAGLMYNLIYTNSARGGARQNLYTIRFSAETSGNVLSWFFSAFNANKSSTGQYNIFGNPFAQYVKGNIDFSQTFPFTSSNSLAFRIGIGVAYPYKNSSIMPFEKRYFAGGPNHVRGWSTRYLGPGSYNGESGNNIAVHVGDINFITSVEYRHKILPWFEPAVFMDAGNIWTIKSYDSQPNGLFKWDKFYKEIAVATGIGLRFDLSFLIIRLDAGTRVYDPAKAEGDRFVLFKGKFFNNSALHFAIGYPF